MNKRYGLRTLISMMICIGLMFGAISMACAEGKPVPPKPIKKMTSEEIVAYAKKLFLGFTGDEHTPMDKFAEDAVFIDVTRPVKKVFKGKKAIGEFLMDYAGMTGWELDILAEAYDAKNNRVGFEWIWRSVHDKGPYDGIPPRGIKTSIMGSTWITINDEGLIQEEKDVWNREHLVQQLCAD
ncbi:MAG: hypothetical protein HKP58_09140 [Desulfatitalea sp.]|nr:hypothetical protein [Desulfatitalea sp.]NNK00565.1 hypothetical protein [Desulfatitalea sp.]